MEGEGEADLISCSLVLGKARMRACSGVRAMSIPSTWCWLKVAIRSAGFRVMWPSVGSRTPDIRFSRVDLPMPAQQRALCGISDAGGDKN